MKKYLTTLHFILSQFLIKGYHRLCKLSKLFSYAEFSVHFQQFQRDNLSPI